jgi:ribosomal-protein-alanine N-acetyltransferase
MSTPAKTRSINQPAILQILPMRKSDLPDVLRVENAAFTTTWPANAFVHELDENRLATYRVARFEGKVVGYGGIWVITEDAHITTIGVHPDHQGRHFGEALFLVLMEESVRAGAAWMSLEVRASNVSAQRLYRKYGFAVISVRKGYYHDNQEDAFVMWAGDLRGKLYGKRLTVLRELLTSVKIV